jgi:NTP pyrophosphatase (non-canonical NTP hydrolase)
MEKIETFVEMQRQIGAAMGMCDLQRWIEAWGERKGWNEDLTDETAEPTKAERDLALIALLHVNLSKLAERVRAGEPLGNPERGRVANPGVLKMAGINVVKVLAKLALVHTEATEAVDSIAAAIQPDEGAEKPQGLGSELADVVIRCFHLAALVKIDLGHEIVRKMAYNETRPFKHGKKA